MTNEDFPKQELWALCHTVGPNGFMDFDGESAMRPTALEARRIATSEGQLRDIMWINFSLVVSTPGVELEEFYPVGPAESFIATSRRTINEVVFRPVSEVIDEGRLTTYSAQWLGWLASGNQQCVPDRFEDLVNLIK